MNSGIEYYIMNYCRGIRPYLSQRYVTCNTYGGKDSEEVIASHKVVNIVTDKRNDLNTRLLVSFHLDDDYKCTEVGTFTPELDKVKEEIAKTYIGVEIRPTLELRSRKTCFSDEFVCELTEQCDDFFPESVKKETIYKDGFYRTYIMPFDLAKAIWALRVPGRTVGEVDTDANGFITKVILDGNCKHYENIKQFRLDEFIGVKLKLPSSES